MSNCSWMSMNFKKKCSENLFSKVVRKVFDNYEQEMGLAYIDGKLDTCINNKHKSNTFNEIEDENFLITSEIIAGHHIPCSVLNSIILYSNVFELVKNLDNIKNVIMN